MSPRRPGRLARSLVASTTALLSVAALGDGAAVAASAPYVPPTDRPVTQPFDLARGRYGAGNRGLDYGVVAGDPIRAIGAGTVVFAGAVAGSRFVTVLHPDGLRSSYSYLATVQVRRGQPVVVGEVLGSSTERFQLGIRRGADYIDPAPLLGRPARPRHARLVR